METLNISDKAEIKSLIERGIRVHDEIKGIREDFKKEVTELAQKINVKPALLNKAIKVAAKSSLSKSREEVETLEEILEAAGRG